MEMIIVLLHKVGVRIECDNEYKTKNNVSLMLSAQLISAFISVNSILQMRKWSLEKLINMPQGQTS